MSLHLVAWGHKEGSNGVTLLAQANLPATHWNHGLLSNLHMDQNLVQGGGIS